MNGWFVCSVLILNLNMKSLLILLLLSCNIFYSAAQKLDRKLNSKIKDLLQGFNGDAGVYIKNQ